MKLIELVFRVNVKPEIKRKRVLSAAKRAIWSRDEAYMTVFAIDGLRVYAEAYPDYTGSLPRCRISAMHNKKPTLTTLYEAVGVSVSPAGLIACIADWINTIQLDELNDTEFGDYRDEDGSARCDIDQLTRVYNDTRAKSDTDCPTPWLDFKFTLDVDY